jgi:hypothetical protein
LATKKKPTKKKATKKKAAKRKTPMSKADVARARGKEPEGPPVVGRLKAGKTKEVQINIPVPKEKTMEVVLVGDSPLVVHAWDEKAIRMMLTDHMKESGLSKKEKEALREPKDPFADMLGSLYHDSDGYLCFRSVAFKKAMISACRHVPGVTMTHLYGCARVLGEFCPLLGWPMNRMDMVKVGPTNNRQPDIRFRAEYAQWAVKLNITVIESLIKPEHVLNLLTWAGRTVGAGEWRVEKGGDFGSFHVASAAEARQISKKLEQHHIDELNPKNTGTVDILQKLKVLYEAA